MSSMLWLLLTSLFPLSNRECQLLYRSSNNSLKLQFQILIKFLKTKLLASILINCHSIIHNYRIYNNLPLIKQTTKEGKHLPKGIKGIGKKVTLNLHLLLQQWVGKNQQLLMTRNPNPNISLRMKKRKIWAYWRSKSNINQREKFLKNIKIKK